MAGSKSILLVVLCMCPLSERAHAQHENLAPLHGVVTLASGFAPDPHVVTMSVGDGAIDASPLGGECRGAISDAPTLALRFQAGALPLIMRTYSAIDPTLVVRSPDGQWHCDDDGAETGLDPLLRFEHPQSGSYFIWVGTYAADAGQTSVALHISETSEQ